MHFISQVEDSSSVSESGSVTVCKSKHLTTFASGLFCMPNTIDFSYVFANAGFQDNLTIYVTIIVLFVIFILLGIWAVYNDKKDVTKLGATPLPDNMTNDKYLYEILVYTGNKKQAQTDSTVQVRSTDSVKYV